MRSPIAFLAAMALFLSAQSAKAAVTDVALCEGPGVYQGFEMAPTDEQTNGIIAACTSALSAFPSAFSKSELPLIYSRRCFARGLLAFRMAEKDPNRSAAINSAFADCDAATNADSNYAPAYFLRGMGLIYLRKKYQAAIAEFSRGYARDKYIGDMLWIGAAAEYAGDQARAIGDYARVIEMPVDDNDAIARGVQKQARNWFAALAKKIAADAFAPPPPPTPPPPPPQSAAGKRIPVRLTGSVYSVPVRINDLLTLDAFVDSGAGDFSIPADVATTLMRTGTISQSDFGPIQRYSLGDGSIREGQQLKIRSLQIGDGDNAAIVTNVPAIIAPATGPLLLGQSFFAAFKSMKLDYQHSLLVIDAD